MKKYICINSGSAEEALDIFQEALIILYRKVNDHKLSHEFNCEGYLVTTCKFLWSNELRKKKIRIGNEQGLEKLQHEDEVQDQLEKETRYKTVEGVLLKLGSKCRNILEQFYFHATSMEQIAKQFGFKTVDAAKVQKYRCLETARKMAQDNQLSNAKNETL